eukprot:s3303_g4.t1
MPCGASTSSCARISAFKMYPGFPRMRTPLMLAKLQLSPPDRGHVRYASVSGHIGHPGECLAMEGPRFELDAG